MKYGIGQKVRVKDFSELKEEYGVEKDGSIVIGEYLFERPMKVYCTEEYCIEHAYADGTYSLNLKDGEEWYFAEEVLCDPNEPKEPEKVEKPKRTYTRRK